MYDVHMHVGSYSEAWKLFDIEYCVIIKYGDKPSKDDKRHAQVSRLIPALDGLSLDESIAHFLDNYNCVSLKVDSDPDVDSGVDVTQHVRIKNLIYGPPEDSQIVTQPFFYLRFDKYLALAKPNPLCVEQQLIVSNPKMF